MPTIIRKPHMNRVYITGDVDAIRDLLYGFRTRHDSAGYWLPIRFEGQLRAAIEAEAEYQAGLSREQSAWDAAKSVIPADYKTRHGAAFGGDVVIDGECISEPALDTSRLAWVRVASHERRVRNLTGQSTINGRVSDSQSLYSAVVADGRTIYRISSSHQFGDDLRETYYLPPDLWRAMMAAEVAMRGITPEQAREWLADYRGCVGTELYEFAAEQSLPCASPALRRISA